MRGELRIAILPFQNLLGQNEVCAEEITSELSRKLGGFAPQSKTVEQRIAQSFREGEKSPGKISQELDVEYLVTGVVVRRASNCVRVTAMLYQSNDLMWADSYDYGPEQLADIHSEVADEIAESLRKKLSGQRGH